MTKNGKYPNVAPMTNIIKEIETYCAQAGIKPSTFGFRAVADGKFFERIKRGGRCWPETEEKVRAYMAENPPEAASERGAA
ncbi:hypothetical protein [Roseovarius mucosus]|uniref:hypothetical protein n=1 Tax=Roseovarius mucosus TaxID=215743 RepID=UPI0035CFE379